MEFESVLRGVAGCGEDSQCFEHDHDALELEELATSFAPDQAQSTD
jgi:hypothetical protein